MRKREQIKVANSISAKQYQKMIKTRQKRKKNNKFGAIITEYNGRKYHSEKEARRAFDLDMLMVSKTIKCWYAQPKFILHALGGEPVGCYIADFKVVANDDTVWFEDVKGVRTALFNWKLRHLKAEYPDVELRIF